MYTIQADTLLDRDFDDAIETLIFEHPEILEHEQFQIKLSLGEIPTIKHPLFVSSVGSDLRGEKHWQVEYEYTLASMIVKNASTPFREPYLSVEVTLNVRVTNKYRLFFREQLVIKQMEQFIKDDASEETIHTWAKQFISDIGNTEDCEDNEIMFDLAHETGDRFQESFTYAMDLTRS